MMWLVKIILLLASATITRQPQSISFKCKERNVLALWIIAIGVGPIYYQWQKYDLLSDSWILPSSRVVNITSPNLTFSIITEEDQGTYHCIIINDDGSVISDDVNITVYGKLRILLCSVFNELANNYVKVGNLA